jgi:hypothetical protein
LQKLIYTRRSLQRAPTRLIPLRSITYPPNRIGNYGPSRIQSTPSGSTSAPCEYLHISLVSNYSIKPRGGGLIQLSTAGRRLTSVCAFCCRTVFLQLSSPPYVVMKLQRTRLYSARNALQPMRHSRDKNPTSRALTTSIVYSPDWRTRTSDS